MTRPPGLKEWQKIAIWLAVIGGLALWFLSKAAKDPTFQPDTPPGNKIDR